MADRPLPPEFRSEVIRPVLKTLTAGESCSLVGVGSSGKSNVARHLTRLDVRQHHLGELAQTDLYLYVNCVKLLDYSAQSIHSHILEALPRATQETGSEMKALNPKLETWLEQAAKAASPDRVRHILEEAIAAAFQAGARQMVVTLDDFDPVVINAPARVLNSLRALRDDFKSRFMYVTITRRELAFLRDADEYQDFHEIISPTTLAVGPYRAADAELMIERLALRWSLPQTLNEKEKQRLLEASGGHAGLLKAMLLATQRDHYVSLMAPNLIEKMRGYKEVEPECQKIWESLEAEETADLLALASRHKPVGEGLPLLQRKGLIRPRSDGAYDLFSPLFFNFVRDTWAEGRFTIILVPGQKTIRIGDRVINDLNEIEFRLFACLYEHQGTSVPRPDLIREMIEGEAGQPLFPVRPERRLDSYMTEIKHKVDTPDQEYVIYEPEGYYRLRGAHEPHHPRPTSSAHRPGDSD